MLLFICGPSDINPKTHSLLLVSLRRLFPWCIYWHSLQSVLQLCPPVEAIIRHFGIRCTHVKSPWRSNLIATKGPAHKLSPHKLCIFPLDVVRSEKTAIIATILIHLEYCSLNFIHFQLKRIVGSKKKFELRFANLFYSRRLQLRSRRLNKILFCSNQDNFSLIVIVSARQDRTRQETIISRNRLCCC